MSEIKDFKVLKKINLTLPHDINGIIVCPNERCVSHYCVSKFKSDINRKNQILVKCHYCEKQFMLNEIKHYKFN